MPLLSPENRLATLEASYGIAPPPGATLDSRTANLEFQLGVVPPGIQSRDNRLAQLEAAINRRIIAQLRATPGPRMFTRTDSRFGTRSKRSR